MVEASSNSTLNNNDPAMESVATKSEPILEGSVSPSVSTPEVEVEALTQDVAQTQKRKGGRKPVRNILFYLLFTLFFFYLFSMRLRIRGPALHHSVCFFHYSTFIHIIFGFYYSHNPLISPYHFVLCHFLPPFFFFFNVHLLILSRSMQPPRSVSNATDRRRRLSVNVAPSISANSSPPSSAMKRACRLSSRITALQLTSV